MTTQDKRYKVKLNSEDKIEQLLQEVYDQACKTITQIQDEITKLTNIDLSAAILDERAKHGKVIHDFIGDKHKAITLKLDIAKFLNEILKHNGNSEDALNDKNSLKSTGLDLEKLKLQLVEGNSNTTNGVASYDLTNRFPIK